MTLQVEIYLARESSACHVLPKGRGVLDVPVIFGMLRTEEKRGGKEERRECFENNETSLAGVWGKCFILCLYV